MALTGDDAYIFVGNEFGNLIQFSTKEKTIVKSYTGIWKTGIWSMLVTPDSRKLFIGGKSGQIKEVSVKKQFIFGTDFGSLAQGGLDADEETIVSM